MSNFSHYYYSDNNKTREMDDDDLPSKEKRPVNFRLCTVSGYTTELLEIRADEPTFNVLVIPGNPGIVTYYKEFVESLYELLGGSATVTGKTWVFPSVGHISQTKKV
ncbi:DUF2305 domain-containing protein, partial [Cephalotus follicularis]